MTRKHSHRWKTHEIKRSRYAEKKYQTCRCGEFRILSNDVVLDNTEQRKCQICEKECYGKLCNSCRAHHQRGKDFRRRKNKIRTLKGDNFILFIKICRWCKCKMHTQEEIESGLCDVCVRKKKDIKNESKV